MSRHILQRDEEDRIKWTGRPGPRKICALPCFTLCQQRVWPLCHGCAQLTLPFSPIGILLRLPNGWAKSPFWFSQTHALDCVGNKTQSWL